VIHARPFDVALAGLGAMGSAAAWQLALRGQRVIGFDRFTPPHGLGSSTGRSRIIREAYWESPVYVPLVRRAYELWSELEAASGRRLLHTTGGLVIGPPRGALVQGALRSAAVHRVPVERLSAAEVRARFPALAPEDPLVGVVEPRAGVLRPEEAITAMLERAAAHGAELRSEEPVLTWKSEAHGVRICTPRGEYTARRLILAAGAWMAGDLPGMPLPLTVQRQVMFWLAAGTGPAVVAPGRLPVWLWETPAGAMWYGFPDLGEGPKVARHHAGQPTTPDTVPRAVGEVEAAEMLEFVAASVPGVGRAVRDAAVCLYTNTPDEHFLVDRHPACGAVLLASPCSGHGFKFAPAIGEILADLAMDRPARMDLHPFALARFAGR